MIPKSIISKLVWVHKTNEDVLKKVEERRSLINIIRTRQKTWIGHIIRGDSLQREIVEERMGGKRLRPKQKLMDWMMDSYGKLKEKAKQREEWSRWTFGPAGRQKPRSMGTKETFRSDKYS